ncbi:putative LRR receptor-like serine/threonine-protein kinase At1g51860 [Carex rostrata]
MAYLLSWAWSKLSTILSDLSSNNLSGALSSSLDQLTALTYLDVRGNNMISTTLPFGLQKRQQNGSLTYRFGDIIVIPSPSPSTPKKNIIVSVAVVVLLLVIAVVIAIVLWLRKHNQSSTVMKDQDSKNKKLLEEASIPCQPKAEGPNFHIIDNHQFSYNDVKGITNDFKNIIGKGGFGDVYFGLLENELEVAVKMRSHSSSQGVKEFLAEANHLARVHHKNLVTLIGYCIDENCMALVYEYMPEGNLQEKLKADDVRPLTWKQRIRIAYQSALGLEYLHKACNPPLIHRDVKASNILLNANLEAKIADFGLSRAFESTGISHVSTKIIGTPGYLDPEYFLFNQLSAKSDVYSFGVVLLEIVTGQSPTNAGSEGTNLVQWVRDKLSEGNIQSIVDAKMEEEYDINSIWKVTDLACRCTELTSSKRPTMDAVVSELKESMYLEFSTERINNENSTDITDVSLDSTSTNNMQEPGPRVR